MGYPVGRSSPPRVPCWGGRGGQPLVIVGRIRRVVKMVVRGTRRVGAHLHLRESPMTIAPSEHSLIVLTGPPGAGKSTIARLPARGPPVGAPAHG